MKMTTTAKTGKNPVTVTEDVPYYVPKRGDRLYVYGFTRVLSEDMRLRVDVTWNEETRLYEGKAMRTKDGAAQLVFIGDHLTWRYGERFDRAGGGMVEQ